MPSVVVAAHDEESVIGACLDSLIAQGILSEEIVVVPNGCTDRTAERARERGVVVVERESPGKADAVNAGEAVARGFPRIYLDADIVVPSGGVAELLAAFDQNPCPLAAAPRRTMNVVGRPWPVRAYFSINERLPVFEHALFGRGMFAISAEGRRRFGPFPSITADDLFADAHFSDAEKVIVPGVSISVETPYRTRDLLRRLVRVRRGNAELRAAAEDLGVDVRSADSSAWLRHVVGRHPALWPAAVPYGVITMLALFIAATEPSEGQEWGRDDSTRRAGHVAGELP